MQLIAFRARFAAGRAESAGDFERGRVPELVPLLGPSSLCRGLGGGEWWWWWMPLGRGSRGSRGEMWDRSMGEGVGGRWLSEGAVGWWVGYKCAVCEEEGAGQPKK